MSASATQGGHNKKRHMAYRTARFPTLSKAIFRTVSKQRTRFQLTERRVLNLQYPSLAVKQEKLTVGDVPEIEQCKGNVFFTFNQLLSAAPHSLSQS